MDFQHFKEVAANIENKLRKIRGESKGRKKATSRPSLPSSSSSSLLLKCVSSCPDGGLLIAGRLLRKCVHTRMLASGLLAACRHYWIKIKLTALTPSNISAQENTVHCVSTTDKQSRVFLFCFFKCFSLLFSFCYKNQPVNSQKILRLTLFWLVIVSLTGINTG